jgi:hypothetical protein
VIVVARDMPVLRLQLPQICLKTLLVTNELTEYSSDVITAMESAKDNSVRLMHWVDTQLF